MFSTDRRCLTLVLFLLALAGLTYAQNPGDVLISESMYDDTANTDLEWAEIYNNTANPIDISSWVLLDGSTYPASTEGAIRVPNGTTIASHQYLVLCRTAIPEFTGEVVCTNYFGSWALGNSGDNLALYSDDSTGILIDGSQSIIIPDSSAVAGNSTERCSFAVGYDVGSNWHQSTNVFSPTGRYRNCSPGAANSACGGGDTTPPVLTRANCYDNTHVDLVWSEALGLASSETEANYTVDGGIGNPLSAVRDVTNTALVHLTFNAIPNGTYHITANGVQDVAGNTSTGQVDTFAVNVTVAFGCVVITEVMYDDTAGTDVEWVELHNTTGASVNLSNWIIADAPDFPPSLEGYWIIPNGQSIAADQFLVFSKGSIDELTIEVACADSSGGGALGNTGDNIALLTAGGAQLVDGSFSVNYPDEAGTNLGNSIEKCDVNAMWSGADVDWHESNAVFSATGRYRHCTPGLTNSSCTVDTTRPEIQTIVVVSESVIDVNFSENLNAATANVAANYDVNFAVGTPSTAVLQGNQTTVRLTFAAPLSPNTYTLTVNNVEDLAANPILPNSQEQFTILDIAEDFVITEIMPNPAFAGNDDAFGEWFEIYNAGASAVNLTGFVIADNAGSDTVESGTINPGQYFVFCSNGDSTTNGGVPENFAYHYATSGWGLSLGNSSDNISIRNTLGQTVASAAYTTAFHWAAGVSMQLKDLSYSGVSDTMWCAAYQGWPGANNGDFGTPGTATACQPIAPPDTASVCDLRAQDACGVATRLQTRVVSRGVITRVDTCGTQAWYESGGCAVAIFGSAVLDTMTNAVRPPLAGDSVMVDGYITQFRGLTEYSTYTSFTPVISYLGSRPIPAAVSLAGSAIATSVDNCGPEAYESRRVTVANATFENGGGTFAPGNQTFRALVGLDTILFYVDSCDATVLGSTIPTGQVNITAIVGQYDTTAACLCGGYQLVYGGGIPFSAAQCVDPTSLTVLRGDSLAVESVLRWQPGLGQTCNTYNIYASTDGSAIFPNTYTLINTVTGVTTYTDLSPFAPRRFYHVTANN